MPDEVPFQLQKEPASPEARAATSVVRKALQAATEAFNAVLLENGLVALDDSYEIEAHLKFTQRAAEAADDAE